MGAHRFIALGGREICLSHLMEAADCTWITYQGRHICIAPGHGKHGREDTVQGGGGQGLSAEATAWLAEIEQHPEIIKGKTLIKSGPTTESLYKHADGTWDAERVRTIQEPIAARMLNPNAVAAPDQQPIAVLYAGAGGSGKTTSLGAYLPLGGKDKFTVINADDVKEQLPEYNGYNAALVHEESSHISEDLAVTAAYNARHNILFDGTGKTPGKYEEMARLFRRLGYRVEIMYASADPLVSTKRAVARFLAMVDSGNPKPRYVDPSYLLKVVDSKPNDTYNLLKSSGLVDRAVKVDNNGATPHLIEDITIRRTAESGDGPGRLSGVGRGEHAQAVGGRARREEAHRKLAESSNEACHWVTIGGRHLCITPGHTTGGLPGPGGKKVYFHGGEPITGNALPSNAIPGPMPKPKKGSKLAALAGRLAIGAGAALAAGALRGLALVHEAGEDCTWVTIGGNHVCITSGHGAHRQGQPEAPIAEGLIRRMLHAHEGKGGKLSPGDQRRLRDLGYGVIHPDHTFTLTDQGREVYNRLLKEFHSQPTSGDSGGAAKSGTGGTIPKYVQDVYDKIKAEYETDLGNGTKTQPTGNEGCMNGYCTEVSQEMASRLRDAGHEAYARRYSKTPDKKAEGGDYGGHWTVVTPQGEFDPTITHWVEPRPAGIKYDQSLYRVTDTSPHAKWTVDQNVEREGQAMSPRSPGGYSVRGKKKIQESVAIGGREVLLEFNPNHVQSGPDGGQFTTGAGGGKAPSAPPYPRPGAHEHAMMDRLRAPDGGFTYNPTTNAEPTKGYAVSPYPERSKVLDSASMTEEDLTGYVVKNWDLLSQPDHHLGAWHDPATGKIYLDVSVVKASEADAKALALAKDQIAYFDLANMKSVDVNRQAKSGQTG